MADDVNVGINVTAEGQALAKQVAGDVAALRAQLTQLYNITNTNYRSAAARRLAQDQEAAAMRRAAAAAAEQAKEQKNLAASTAATGFSLNALTARVLEMAAAFAGFQAFKSFVAEGLEFNKTIETANLGIASLITSQTQMSTANGRLVTGVEKLQIAQELATDQVQKLRIAGLQTTATTQELVVAFQQAVGVGLRWGLTLDQIRVLTIQMSQAAGALGLPMNQLNEEIRDLLGGNINPRNTRIATALGITNEQIKTAQKAGTLFEFVTSRLEAFSVAGEATAKTFSGVMSNIREALQNLAGDATKPLFDTLKTTGQATLEDIFDMKNARISSKFAGILDVAKQVFGDLGNLLADAIGAGVEGAKEFSQWLKDNRVEVAQIYENIKLIGDELVSLARDSFGLLTSLTETGVQTGFIKTALAGAGLIVAEIHTAFQGLLLVLGTIGGVVLTALIAPFVGWLRIIARVVSLFNEDLGQSIDNAASKGNDFIVGLREGLAKYNHNLAESGTATDQFIKKLEDADAKAAANAIARGKLSEALQRATDGEIQATAALDAQLKASTITQTQYAEQVRRIKLASINAQIDAEKAYFNTLDASDNRERRRTLTTIQELKKRAEALRENITLKSTAELTQKDSASKAEQGETIKIKAQLAEQLSALKLTYDQQKISIRDYYKERVRLQQEAVDKEIAALRTLEKSQTDKGAIAKTEDQIKALMAKRNQIVTDETDAETKAYTALDEEVMRAHVQLLKDQGRLTDAAALETGTKFKKLIAQLQAEVKAGTRPQSDLDIVSQLFGIDTAKTKLEELQKQAKVVTDTLAVRLSEINTESQTHAINEKEARVKIVDAYKQAKTQLEAMLPAMREQAALTGDPNQINAVEEMAIKIQQMSISIQQASDDLLKLKTAGREAFEEGLGQFIDDAVAGAKSLHDAWRDAAQGIINALRRVASQMLANLIIQKTLELFGFSGGGLVGGGGGAKLTQTLSGGPLGGAVTAASGGFITGPGTATSDSIPAWLSHGEYVIRAHAVKAVGLELLDQINAQGATQPRLRRRTRGYAEGGLVAAPSNDMSVNSHLTVSLERGLIVEHMESDAGQKVTFRTIEKNATKIRRALGL